MDINQGPLSQPTAPPYPGPPLNPNFESINSQFVPDQNFVYQCNRPLPLVRQTEAPAVVVVQPLPTDVPGWMVCPHCQNSVVTEIEYKNSVFIWMMCMMLGLLLCFPFIWIPFCITSCKDVAHSCPNCHKVIHIHKPTQTNYASGTQSL